MNKKSFYKSVAIISFLFTMIGSSQAIASGGPQVLPSFKSDRSMVKNPIPKNKELAGHSSDPYEAVNRKVWAFNYDYLDRYALRPIAHGYLDYLPDPVVQGVHNFLSNIHEVNNTVNNLAVAEVADSAISVGRFVINSTIGILGIFDVAKHMGMERKEMSFDTVLGRWGVNSGPYLQVPFVAMQTPRTITGYVVDSLYLPWYRIDWGWKIAYLGLNALDTRAQLVAREEMIDNAMDPYISGRDFYLQYINGKVKGKEGILEEEKNKDIEDQQNLAQYMDEIDD